MSDLQKIHAIALLSHILTVVYFINWPIITLLMIFPISLIWFHLGHGVFIHRYFTHRHFEFSNFGILLGHIIYVVTNMGPAIMWAGMHVKHHRTSGTDQDPHEWRRVGLLKAIFSNYGEAFSVDLKAAVRLKKEPYVKFFTVYHYKLLILMLIPFAPIIAMSFWWKQFTTIAVHLDHGDTSERVGSDTSTNIHWLHWLMWGDEKHTDHHNNTRKADLGDDYIYRMGKLWEKI
jgi:fatty-acid desaturase